MGASSSCHLPPPCAPPARRGQRFALCTHKETPETVGPAICAHSAGGSSSGGPYVHIVRAAGPQLGHMCTYGEVRRSRTRPMCTKGRRQALGPRQMRTYGEAGRSPTRQMRTYGEAGSPGPAICAHSANGKALLPAKCAHTARLDAGHPPNVHIRRGRTLAHPPNAHIRRGRTPAHPPYAHIRRGGTPAGAPYGRVRRRRGSVRVPTRRPGRPGTHRGHSDGAHGGGRCRHVGDPGRDSARSRSR